MLEERSGCQFYNMHRRCRILLPLLSQICVILRDHLQCYHEKYLHLPPHEQPRTSIVSLTALGYRLVQITHLVLQQGLYSPDYHRQIPRRDYLHRNREVYIVQLEIMKRRKSRQFLRYRRHTSRRKILLQINHSSTSASRVCPLTRVASIAHQQTACQGGVLFENRRRMIENQRLGNMDILRTPMWNTKIKLRRSRRRTCNHCDFHL